MTQFDIWTFNFPKQGEHPCVLISHPDRCARAEVVNVLYCTSQKQNRILALNLEFPEVAEAET